MTLDHPRYEPGERLGSGAQGLVVRVRDREAPERQLVAKLWRPGVFSQALLEGEFALLARLTIPGLVRAYDLGRDRASGAPFLVEDWVPGPDAREYLADAEGRDRIDRLIRLIAEVSETLALLHDAGSVHGDLKPAHVRVAEGGRATVLDLGAAVSRSSGNAIAVTAGYAAPEVIAGAPPSPRSDLYSFGALLWTAATGAPPSSGRRLRAFAPWVLPGIEDLALALLAEHPEDRPESAREVLSRLARALPSGALDHVVVRHTEAAGATLRVAELTRLSTPARSVRYVMGPAGSGKSHLVRELVTRALLCGRDARWLRFPCDDPELVLRLLAYLRGEPAARPFPAAAANALVVLDDVQFAPEELRAALEVYRCRPGADLDVVVATRDAPRGAPRIELEPLPAQALARLCRELGEDDAQRIAELCAASGGSPGWIAAAIARVPLTREAALERAAQLGASARELLAVLAIAGAPLADDVCSRVSRDAAAALAELGRARLVRRRARPSGAAYELAEPALQSDLAAALGSFELVDALAAAVLDHDVAVRVSTLIAIAAAPHPPARRAELLHKAIARARLEGLRAEETDALLALAADPKERSREVLVALDRVTRGGGSAGLHPEILGWLSEAAERDPSLSLLALRRRAEQAARGGDMARAGQLADQAALAAERSGDPGSLALALSTQGAIALYRADWALADEILTRAYATIVSSQLDDSEELARLLHNRGVVALYKGRVAEALEAFTRSLDKKRRMADRGGIWACLLNLGLALAQSGSYDQAERALEEALELTRSLEQRSGSGWCLAALSDVAVRRGDARLAERWLSQAEHLGSDLPAAVRADTCILRAEIALLDGDGRGAEAALDSIDPELRTRDALIDVRASIARARALLARLPAEPRRAARLAVAAARVARTAGLAEPAERALEVLARARGSRRSPVAARANPAGSSYAESVAAPDWSFLERLAAGADLPCAATDLARTIIASSGAERVFLASVTRDGEVVSAFGVDLDGLEIADGARRIPSDAVRAALGCDEPLYQREVESAAGRGSRLVVAAPTATDGADVVVVVEHRFVSARFDGVSSQQARRWGVLAAIVFRLGREPSSTVHTTAPAGSRVRELAEPSTALPARARRRDFPTIIGESSAIERALARLDQAVDSDLPVLIVGETGVGKELFARALHDHGRRARAAFVAVSCGAIPDSLFEAELFGHVRGSFTGADRARAGLLARAEGGTLFLDEVGELPLARQATLLRALATRSYRPVGSDEEKPFDVRIVAATNRDLERSVAEGSFRQDLLYRLNVLEMVVPPLRARAGDVLAIARAVLARHGSRAEISPAARRVLEAHDWPGNVRELEHQMQRLAALGLQRIEPDHLSREVRASRGRSVRPFELPRRPERREAGLDPDHERAEVRAALDATGGNITRAAERLGLTRHGLKKRMVRLGLRPAPGESAREPAGVGEGKP